MRMVGISKKPVRCGLLICVLSFGILSSGARKWRVFSNRGGWSIRYPSNWKIASCHSCTDPANLNAKIKEERFTVNGLPALKVRYRNPDNGGSEMEDVYVIWGSRTFSVSFSGCKPGSSLEKMRNYETFLQMVASFRVK